MKLYNYPTIYTDTQFKGFKRDIKYLYEWVRFDWNSLRENSSRPVYIDKRSRTHFEICGWTHRGRANITIVMNPVVSGIHIIIDLGNVTSYEKKEAKTYTIHSYPRRIGYPEVIDVPKKHRYMKVKLGSIHY